MRGTRTLSNPRMRCARGGPANVGGVRPRHDHTFALQAKMVIPEPVTLRCSATVVHLRATPGTSVAGYSRSKTVLKCSGFGAYAWQSPLLTGSAREFRPPTRHPGPLVELVLSAAHTVRAPSRLDLAVVPLPGHALSFRTTEAENPCTTQKEDNKSLPKNNKHAPLDPSFRR
jgi:hypothetical protein